PDRLAVAALGDGGALMGVSELETVARLGLEMVVIVYDDEAYGAEVHHFGPDGDPLDVVRFPPADIAAIGRGFGFDAVTVRDAAAARSAGLGAAAAICRRPICSPPSPAPFRRAGPTTPRRQSRRPRRPARRTGRPPHRAPPHRRSPAPRRAAGASSGTRA